MVVGGRTGRLGRGSVQYRVLAASLGDQENPLPSSQSEMELSKPSQDQGLQFVVPCVFMASLSALCFGYHLSVVNGPLEAITFSATGVTNNLVAQGLVVSTLLMGATFGSLVAGKLADSMGRKKTLLLCGLVLALGPALCVILPGLVPQATRFSALILGRVITGVGVGIASSICPLYISEVSPNKLRGSLGSVNQLTICVGIVLGLLANLIYSASQWRIMFLWSTLPGASLAFCAQWVLPESPRYLASRNLGDKAREAALRLWGSTSQALEEARNMLNTTPGMEEEEEEESPSEKREKPSIFSKKYRKVLTMCVMMFVFQQMSGINSIVFYSSSIFRQVGIQSTALASLTVGVVNMLGTGATCFLIDKMGRRQLMQISYSSMAIAIVVMAASTLSGTAGWASVMILVSVIAYVLAFSLGAGAVPGLYVNEIAPSSVRGQAGSAAFTTHWIMNIIIGQTFLQLAEKFGISAMYFLFAAWCFGALLFINKYAVETKGRSMDEIAKAFVAS